MRGDGYVYQRGEVWWAQYSVAGKRVREAAKVVDRHGVRRPARTEADALRFLRDRRRELDGGRFLGPQEEKITVVGLLDALHKHQEAKKLKSLRKIASHSKPLREFFALRRAVEVTPELVDRYKAKRREAGRAPATINRELEVLKHAYRLAVKHRRISAGRVPDIEYLRVDNVRQGFFTMTEVERLLPHLEADLQDFVRWCAFTGMRKGEAAAMEWSILDRSGPTWVLNLPWYISKINESRVLPLAGTARSIIERRLAARRLGCEWIFHRTSKGQPGQPVKAFDKAWRNALKAAKLPKDRLFHDLRRSAVRNLIRAGVDPLQAMAVSGHRTRSIFDRYNITAPEEVAAAMLKVDEAKTKGHI